MKVFKIAASLAAVALAFGAGSANAMTVSSSSSATDLASLLGGSGVTISNATLTTASASGAGTFDGAASAIGFDKGVLLTTGTVGCAPGPNNQSQCTGSGAATSLKFDFTSDTGNVFFNYVFASEEYNEFVGSEYNDSFELLLNGVNIALLPNGGGVVSINNVNNNSNSAYFKDNTGGIYDTQYDGLTTVLTATATGLSGTNTFEFRITDVGDTSLDSGVFIQGGTFSSVPTAVPEPATVALFALGLLGFALARRRV